MKAPAAKPDDRLTRMAERQEALIASVDHLAGSVETTNATLAEVVLWLKEPPSSELPDLIKALVATVQALNVTLTTNMLQTETLTATVTAMGARISALRDTIIKATSE